MVYYAMVKNGNDEVECAILTDDYTEKEVLSGRLFADLRRDAEKLQLPTTHKIDVYNSQMEHVATVRPFCAPERRTVAEGRE